MLTYLNGHCERVEVTNKEDITVWYEVDKVLNSLSDEQFEEMLEIVGGYVWEGGRANANKIRGLAKRLGLKWQDLEMWYYIED